MPIRAAESAGGLRRAGVFRTHRHQGAASADALGIDVRVVFRHARPRQRAQQPACGSASTSAGQRRYQPPCRNNRSNTWDSERPDPGQ